MDSSSDLGFDYQPDLPVPISVVGGRYLIFDVKIATYLRREHRICGAQIGTLPLAPSQNVFLGMPAEIMPEEAQLLVERGVAYILDEARAHDQALHSAEKTRRDDYLASIEQQSREFEEARSQEKEQARQRALKKQSQKSAKCSVPRENSTATNLLDFEDSDEHGNASTDVPGVVATDRSNSQASASTAVPSNLSAANTVQITPATSELLLPIPPSTPRPAIKDLPPSYPLYRHLHDKGYFTTPGLRFGCQYTVYPGDPLRFHSHFLAVGAEWDEPIDLMNIVGGGRLGTGVKKGFLLGGASPAGDVRTFSVEWAAM
ncbi:tRNA-intron endonuclease [Exophiala viscosa]|uniref:tRNA-splicing endonuclease subunit Sen34 n=1 Tax=Exophiala viscosa TaxID=2486360 RepID=A0AAN6E0Z3_9EURO|nr:tRNA-intron endonuclease [Exophiala viscosa]KAI1624040.1 tRNA-intron endonuclease [Exophiala viscosa]